jgi:pimeloyl-ACP methyl ester carboxylesterase
MVMSGPESGNDAERPAEAGGGFGEDTDPGSITTGLWMRRAGLTVLEYPPAMASKPSNTRPVVFLHGWCGHADEVEFIRSALPGPVLPISWMPAAGEFNLEEWPTEPDPEEKNAIARRFADRVLERVRQTILDAGFAGSSLVGHSLGGGMSCVLAADPSLSIDRVIMLDSSVPMPDPLRRGYLTQMIPWVDRAAAAGRLVTQAGWIAEVSSWVPDFFSLEDQGESRLRIERRFMFAPVVEAALMVAGGVQWPISDSVASITCPVFGFAGEAGRMPVEELRRVRPDARVDRCPATGHYPHVFAAERTRAWLESDPLPTTLG